LGNLLEKIGRGHALIICPGSSPVKISPFDLLERGCLKSEMRQPL
jgi:hypothetical protein